MYHSVAPDALDRIPVDPIEPERGARRTDQVYIPGDWTEGDANRRHFADPLDFLREFDLLPHLTPFDRGRMWEDCLLDDPREVPWSWFTDGKVVEREDFRFQVLPGRRYPRKWALDDLLVFLSELNDQWKPADTVRYYKPTGTDPAYFRFTFRCCVYGRSILVHMSVSGFGIKVIAPRQ
jgi:hypothetical protein